MEVVFIHTAEGNFASKLLAAFRAAVEKCVERIVIGREIKSFKRVLFPLGPTECVCFRWLCVEVISEGIYTDFLRPEPKVELLLFLFYSVAL